MINRFDGAGRLQELAVVGNPALLDQPLLAVFCSQRCPGALILQAYDLGRALRASQTPVIGGFHTPIEKDLLDILLKGKAPIVICLARSLQGLRIPAAWRPPIAQGRLLLLSPFAAEIRRPTRQTAARRNLLAGSLAERTLIIHAQPGGQTAALCNQLLAEGKPVFTLADPANAHLIDLGAQTYPVPLEDPR